MNLDEIVKSGDVLKLLDFLLDRCSSGKGLTDAEKEAINSFSTKSIDEKSVDMVDAKVKKIMNLDIIKSDFKMFEGLIIWRRMIYPRAVNIVDAA